MSGEIWCLSFQVQLLHEVSYAGLVFTFCSTLVWWSLVWTAMLEGNWGWQRFWYILRTMELNGFRSSKFRSFAIFSYPFKPDSTTILSRFSGWWLKLKKFSRRDIGSVQVRSRLAQSPRPVAQSEHNAFWSRHISFQTCSWSAPHRAARKKWPVDWLSLYTWHNLEDVFVHTCTYVLPWKATFCPSRQLQFLIWFW